jgi:hypothetical protein
MKGITQMQAYRLTVAIILTFFIGMFQFYAQGNPQQSLLIDDFESGTSNWDSKNSGTIEITNNTPKGKSALQWTAQDDGIGHIAFKNLSKEKIDFSKYDALVFWVKVEGKPIWNLNPVVQQYPAAYGYRALYYTVDTLYPFNQWFCVVQDLSRWENAWKTSFDAKKQEFQFEVHQLAGAGKTRITIDDIRLIKNPIGVKSSYYGKTTIKRKGIQITEFEINLKNKLNTPLHVIINDAAKDSGALNRFKLKLPESPITINANETGNIKVYLEVDTNTAKTLPAWYGESARLAISLKEYPELKFYTECTTSIKPAKTHNPSILCTPQRMKELQAQYISDSTRKKMPAGIIKMVKAAEKALKHVPTYPLNAFTGRRKDPVSNGKLVEVDVPNLPFSVYQDPKSGRTYSGPFYDAGMKRHLHQHMMNARTAHDLAIGYLITGNKDMAKAASEILKAYITRYLKLPMHSIQPGSPVNSATSGSTRIGGTFMRERVWLTNLAIALDCIIPAKVLTQAEREEIKEKVFIPSASNMMNHKVGVMNLQWQIQAAALNAGLATNDPYLVSRSVYDRHGILNLIKIGFLKDGHWWENPSYQGVAKLAALPVIATCIQNNIISWDKTIVDILKASYNLHAPDTRSPTLGTGGLRTLRQEDTAIHIFIPWIDDPQLAWIIHNRKPLAGTYGLDTHALIRGGTPKIKAENAKPIIPTKTTIMPDYGGIAMRLPDTDNYCYVHYGRELTHGHRNKLSFQAFGKKGWFARNIMGGYEHNFTDFLETNASSNVIMVDGKNADTDTGELVAHISGEGFEAVSVKENGAWKDGEHERVVVLTKGPLIVIDRCKADTSHTYQWLYHANICRLSLDKSNYTPDPDIAFGDSKHFASLTPRGKISTSQNINWLRKNKSGMKMSFLNGGEIIAFNTKQTYRPSDGIMWRKKGKTVRFAAALWPYAKGEDGTVSITSLPVTNKNGVQVDLSLAQAVKVTAPEGIYTVLVNYSKQNLSAGDLTSKERIAVKLSAK